ncbi:hypothetical protein BDQ12DRAFT_649878 [Crucibulum laeve]|uniref:Uncharacterized protein n=1 Tax=Crucibulum laeve TaxID=68775 RepID=A0A5C3M2P0_9AGAR|nr:hypothetical protein BDQ12DRAFT_649878 [Crucibulum laeve]
MLKNGTFAVAVVKRQVVVVQASRSHTKRDKYIDVQTYSLFGERVFLASDVPSARISNSDILTVFPLSEKPPSASQGILELPQQAFSQFIELSSNHQKRSESLWSAWLAKH